MLKIHANHLIRLKILFTVFTLFLFGCSQKRDSLPDQITAQGSAQEITYCNMDESELCLEGFGTEADEKLIILFKVIGSEEETEIYLRVNEAKENILFECFSSEQFLENIYCSGVRFPNGDEISINVYGSKDNNLITAGNFRIQYGNIVLPKNLKMGSENSDYNQTRSEPVDYPNIDYPNVDYPNYPNTAP